MVLRRLHPSPLHMADLSQSCIMSTRDNPRSLSRPPRRYSLRLPSCVTISMKCASPGRVVVLHSLLPKRSMGYDNQSQVPSRHDEINARKQESQW